MTTAKHTVMVGTVPIGTRVRRPGGHATLVVSDHEGSVAWVQDPLTGREDRWPDDRYVEVVDR